MERVEKEMILQRIKSEQAKNDREAARLKSKVAASAGLERALLNKL